MPRLTASLRTAPFMALILIASLAFPLEPADAQQRERRDGQGLFQKPHRGPVIGGTSWTLSDVWGEPEMPEPSRDNPGFDYPPGGYDLNGPPSRAPYPN